MAVVQFPIKRRRPGNGEEAWLNLFEELGHSSLRSGLISAGMSPQVAGNVVWFLEDQRTLDRSLSKATRNNYRRALAELNPAEVRRLATRTIPGQFNPRHAA